MTRSFWRFLCLTVALPVMLAACTATPTGTASGIASSKGAIERDDISLPGADEESEEPVSVAFPGSSAAVSSKAASSQALSSQALSSQAVSSQAVSSAPYVPPADTRVIDGKTYTITFVDEFEGNKLDTKKWDYAPNWERGDLNPKGKWDDSMVSVSDGCLHLGIAIGADGAPISGAVRTFKKNYSRVLFSQCKGYFECRCQLQTAGGLWGAFWLLTLSGMDESNNTDGSVDGAEIDIFESFSLARGGINHAIHWNGYGANHKGQGKEVYDRSLYQGFHTYGLAWTDTEYVFYIDGKETWRTKAGGVCNAAAYLKLTAECGTWAGTLQKSKLPDEILVDYVRVWQEQK